MEATRFGECTCGYLKADHKAAPVAARGHKTQLALHKHISLKQVS